MTDDTLRMEVFATGNHGGMEWSFEDLDEIAANFTKLGQFVKPAIKLGHDSKQILAQKDGQPSLGWIASLERVGNKLVATATDVPTALKDLIKKRRYARVSSELYPKFEATNAEKNLKTGVTGKVLSAVALLGADVPAVKNLQDLQAFLAAEGLESAPVPTHFADDEPVTPMVSADSAPLDGNIPFTPESHPPRKAAMAEKEKPEVTPAPPAAPQPDPEVIKLREQMEKQAEEHRALLATLKEQGEELKRRAEREAAADARARRMEAEAFAERCMQNGVRCTQAQRPWLIALHEKLSAMDTPLVLSSEGEGLKLFGESEKPRDLSARECLEAFIDRIPDASAVLRMYSTNTDKPVNDLDTAVEAICLREKWDSKDPAAIAKATSMAVREQSHLMPTYGGRALYRQ